MKERHYFTKSSTFDINYLLEKPVNKDIRKKTEPHKFDKEAIFDVNNIIEK